MEELKVLEISCWGVTVAGVSKISNKKGLKNAKKIDPKNDPKSVQEMLNPSHAAKNSHWHFSKSVSLLKYCTKKTFFSPRCSAEVATLRVAQKEGKEECLPHKIPRQEKDNHREG